MPDNPKFREPFDSGRINIHQAYERGYWSARLRVSDIKLKLAVKMVGCHVADVRKWLETHPD
jgi:hypothetical protein